jgi:hypothetical protein
MPIELERERLITFGQLARKLPSRRNGRPVHGSTIHRWRHPGVGGVRLEAIRIGGAWHTSWEAFQRFCEQLTRGQENEAAAEIGGASDVEHDQVNAELDAEKW